MQHMAVLDQMVADDLAVRAVSPAHAMVTSVGIRAVPIHAVTVEYYRRVQCPQGLSDKWAGRALCDCTPCSRQRSVRDEYKTRENRVLDGDHWTRPVPLWTLYVAYTTLSAIYRDMVSRNGHERQNDMRARSQPSGGWTNPAARVRVDWRQIELAAKVRFASKC